MVEVMTSQPFPEDGSARTIILEAMIDRHPLSDELQRADGECSPSVNVALTGWLK
jgi:hypothetical protein